MRVSRFPVPHFYWETAKPMTLLIRQPMFANCCHHLASLWGLCVGLPPSRPPHNLFVTHRKKSYPWIHSHPHTFCGIVATHTHTHSTHITHSDLHGYALCCQEKWQWQQINFIHRRTIWILDMGRINIFLYTTCSQRAHTHTQWRLYTTIRHAEALYQVIFIT